jgi:arabinose-5-phosphate isomerase
MIEQVSSAEPTALAGATTEIELIEYARSVLRVEARALEILADDVGADFVRAVDVIARTKGRVIVSGMGKSGHVGRKIAATFASTGTPSHFVHPAEAAHGDLGMLLPEDVLLVLSNSGDTAELLPIMAYARAIGVPIIGVAGQPLSQVIRTADVPLLLPAVPEACPVGLAPTTSTTATLGLGDALAMALMRQRSFSRQAFRALHPGGKIGLRLMQIAELMHGPAALPLVGIDTPMIDVIMTMTEKSFGIAGVIDKNGRLVGSISDGDLRRNASRLMTVSARDVMHSGPRTVLASEGAEDTLRLMHECRISAIFVVSEDGDQPIGLVHIHDFLRVGLSV